MPMKTERRKYERFLAPENALVALYGQSIKVGKLVDISRGGLSFEHIYEVFSITNDTELEISFWVEEFRLSKFPCRIVYNIVLPPAPEYEFLTIRLKTYRCGVKFKNLTDEQKEQLDQFIKKYGQKKPIPKSSKNYLRPVRLIYIPKVKMVNSFLNRIKNEILVMSGAMGTVMQKSGSDLGGCLSNWIIEHPEIYKNLVKEYFQVGCHIVAGATSTANRISLAKFGLQEKVAELNQGVIKIIKESKPAHAFVAGNIGPSGKILKPWGDLSPHELFDAYGEQASFLAESGAEIINILTMYDLEEAVLALQAAKRITSLPVIVSLAFDSTPKGFRTMMGISPEVAAKKLEEGADVIGTNCGRISLAQATEILKLMRSSCSKPLLAKPNAGSPQLIAGEEKYATGPDQFAEYVEEWVQAGAHIVSACCGSAPIHLQKMIGKLTEKGLLKR